MYIHEFHSFILGSIIFFSCFTWFICSLSPSCSLHTLQSLYESIKRTPFRLPGDDAGDALTFINPERNGWLVKQGGGHKTWHRRWFTLCNNCLYYFAREKVSMHESFHIKRYAMHFERGGFCPPSPSSHYVSTTYSLPVGYKAQRPHSP